MTEELKPVNCGCGGEARCYMTHYWGECFTVQCSECGIETKPHDTESEAIEAWNRAMGTDARTLIRTFAYDATCAICDKKKKERTAKVDIDDGDYYCGNCAQELPASYRYCPTCGARLDWE